MYFIDLHSHLRLIPGPFSFFLERFNNQCHDITALTKKLKEKKQKAVISVVLYNVPVIHRGLNGIKGQIKTLEKQIKNCPGVVRIIESKSDLEGDYDLGIVLQLESARWMDNFQDDISSVKALGVRGIIPIHFCDNKIGKSCNSPPIPTNSSYDFGLNPGAEQFFEICRTKKIWVDGSHMSDRALSESLRYKHHKFCISHTALNWVQNNQRAISKENFNTLKDQKSFLGLCVWKNFCASKDLYQKQIQEFSRLDWPSGVGIGTDLGAPINASKGLRNHFELVETVNNFDLEPDQKINFLWKNAYNFLAESLT
jgi:microsomal dipeptidase-like Zn-dependent dipeptidase